MIKKDTFFVVLLMIWPLFSPLASALRQASGVYGIGDFYKIYYIICVFFALTFLNKKCFKKKSLAWLAALLLIGLLGSFVNFDSFDVYFFVSHSAVFFSFTLFFLISSERHAVTFSLLARKLMWLNVVWSAILLLLFRVGFFGDAGYTNFDVSGLFITYVYCLVYTLPTALLAHIALFYMSEKRALFVVALILYIFYKSGLFVICYKNAKVALFLSIFFSALVSLQIVEIANVGELDASTLERVSEIYSVYRELMTNTFSNVFGRGFGWFYNLTGFQVEYEANELRGFVHATPVFFHVTYGLTGVVFYAVVLLRILRMIGTQKDHVKLFGLYALAMMIAGLTRLNFFTEPLFMLAIGMALTWQDNYSSLYNASKWKNASKFFIASMVTCLLFQLFDE